MGGRGSRRAGAPHGSAGASPSLTRRLGGSLALPDRGSAGASPSREAPARREPRPPRVRTGSAGASPSQGSGSAGASPSQGTARREPRPRSTVANFRSRRHSISSPDSDLFDQLNQAGRGVCAAFPGGRTAHIVGIHQSPPPPRWPYPLPVSDPGGHRDRLARARKRKLRRTGCPARSNATGQLPAAARTGPGRHGRGSPGRSRHPWVGTWP